MAICKVVSIIQIPVVYGLFLPQVIYKHIHETTHKSVQQPAVVFSNLAIVLLQLNLCVERMCPQIVFQKGSLYSTKTCINLDSSLN